MAGRFQRIANASVLFFALAAATSTAFAAAKPKEATAGSKDADSLPRVNRSIREPVLSPTLQASAGMAGDVFPAFANHLAEESPSKREFGILQVKITNPAASGQILRARISVHISGWSEEETQNVELPPGASKTLNFAPPLVERAFRNREVSPALAQVRAIDSAGTVLYAGSLPLRIRAADDMYWGNKFIYAPMIASWVTPHDSAVEKLLSRAKEYMPGRRLPGYEPWKDAAGQEASTRLQAQAIYLALQKQGVSYVKSSLTFGNAKNSAYAERIRTPRESLLNGSANCIDGVVMFASLFENLGMDPEIIVIPGHAYVGVRVAQNSSKYLLIDTALIARVPFERAVAIAEKGITSWKPGDITRVSVTRARGEQIYPMPDGSE
ncbi:MAG: hypothetical protein ABI383_04490 [Acidobacteriaceae bacterium]